MGDPLKTHGRPTGNGWATHGLSTRRHGRRMGHPWARAINVWVTHGSEIDDIQDNTTDVDMGVFRCCAKYKGQFRGDVLVWRRC